MRKFLFAVIAIVIGLAAPLIAAEIVLRFLPVSSALRTEPVDAAHPVGHFEPNRDFVHSTGWSLERPLRGHVNNEGFVNAQDYDKTDTRPLLAVVGDSYIQAVMVPFDQTLEARLAATVGPKGRVYSFAQSGAPLSQYLVWAEYAARTYKAAGVVITVVDNDFDESLLKYKRMPSQHYFAETADDRLELRLVEFHPSWIRNFASQFALVRYFMLNVNVLALLDRLRYGSLPPNNYHHASPADIPAELLVDSYRGIDEFLAELPARTGLPPERLLLAVDAVRDNIYAGDGSEHNAYFTLMRDRLLSEAATGGFETIDLNPIFSADWRANHRRFDYPDDGHWDGYGHGIVAGAVTKSRLIATLFGTPSGVSAAPAGK